MIEAISLVADATAKCFNSVSCQTGLPSVSADNSQLKVILQIVIGVLAAFAVLMATIGGLRYVMSEGNPESTKQARGTIVFAIIGLVIAVSAEAIVSFVLGRAS